MDTTPELGGLGSLAQSARAKQLGTARGILLFVGVVTILGNAFFFAFAEKMVDQAIDQELASPEYRNLIVDQDELATHRERAVLITKVINGVGVGIGVLYLFFGIYVKKYPVPITITSLVLYIGSLAVFGYMDPMSLARGWLIKILIIVGLFKAVQAAIAFESERKSFAEESSVEPNVPLSRGETPSLDAPQI